MWLGHSPRLYAYTGGRAFDPTQPTVVFLHGGQHDHSVWALQSRYLAHHGYGVLAFDLPAHGRSQGSPLPSIEAMADAIAAALQASGSGQWLLAGHSMGSLIALETARRLPDSTRGVALLATAFPMRVSDALLSATRGQPAEAMAMINVWSHSPATEAVTSKPNSPGPGFSNTWINRRLMESIERRNGTGVLAADFAACNAYRGGTDAVQSLKCPTLFVLGERDSMTPPKSAQTLIEACGDATVVRLPCGHALMAEAPDATRRALWDFARRVFAN